MTLLRSTCVDPDTDLQTPCRFISSLADQLDLPPEGFWSQVNQGNYIVNFFALIKSDKDIFFHKQGVRRTSSFPYLRYSRVEPIIYDPFVLQPYDQ